MAKADSRRGEQAEISPIVSYATPFDYFTLLKPRVMSLVVFTGFCGVLLAPQSPHPFFIFLIVLMIAIGSGAAGAINMWYERDIDVNMRRTANRPLPRKAMASADALAFGVILAVGAVFIMMMVINWLAGGLLLAAILFYVFIYTIWLKPRTPQNIVIGGAAGAFPPMIGWAAATGEVSWQAILLFSLIFFWTPPHFWALALIKRDEYRNVNIPMLPVVKGDIYTKNYIIFYSLLLMPLVLGFYFWDFSSIIYALLAFLLTAEFIRRAVMLRFDAENKTAFGLFRYSIIYLTLIFVLLVIDRLWFVEKLLW